MEKTDLSKRKQGILILLSVLAYAAVYVGRYSYSASIGSVMTAYGVTRAEAGLVSTFFFFSYGASQIFHAFFCKYYPKKYAIPTALTVMALLNFVMFLKPPFALIKYLWLANGIVQALVWPTVVDTWSKLLDVHMTERAVFFISMSLPLGTVISYGSGALFNLFSFWQGTFFIGFIIPALIGAAWLLLYDRLSEGKCEKVPFESKTSDKSTQKNKVGKAFVCLIAASMLLIALNALVRDGLTTWAPVILKEQFGLNDSNSIIMTLVLPIFGIFGSALAMRANRRIKNFGVLGIVFFAAMCVLLAGALLCFKLNSLIVVLLIFGLVSCLTHSVTTTFVSIMPLSANQNISSGFLTGIINASGYVGSTVSAYGLGAVADNMSWNAVIEILTLVAAAAIIFCVIALAAYRMLPQNRV